MHNCTPPRGKNSNLNPERKVFLFLINLDLSNNLVAMTPSYLFVFFSLVWASVAC